MNWHDVFSRAARTFLQAFIGVFLALTVTGGIAEVPTLDVLQRAALAALWAGFVAVVTWLQNALEEDGFLPELFGKATLVEIVDEEN